MAASSSFTTPNFSKLHRYPSLHIEFTRRNLNLKVFSCLSLHQTDENQSISTKSTTVVRIVFAAGGTGGRIYPAVAIADELKSINPNVQILFLGTETGMESTAIPSAGYDFKPIQAFPLIRPLISSQNLVFPLYLIKSMIYTWKVLRDFGPNVVFGTGGYVSAPVCFSAKVLKGVKLVLQEQNSVPGLANRVISIFADMVFVAFPSTVKYFRKEKCIIKFLAPPLPIRLSLRRHVSKADARLHFFPKAAKNQDSEFKVVLILGGSLGANAINIAVLNMYYQMLLEHKYMYIVWQTGVETFTEMESLVKSHSRVVLMPFLHKMDLAYAAADLVVSRAGAMTCSEILSTGKPSILIPSPNVAEGHQEKNAFIMSNLAGSRVILEDELESTTLRTAIEDILGDEHQMADMHKRAMKAARPEASVEIAQYILSLGELSEAKGRRL